VIIKNFCKFHELFRLEGRAVNAAKKEGNIATYESMEKQSRLIL
jgi:hypothetical protein